MAGLIRGNRVNLPGVTIGGGDGIGEEYIGTVGPTGPTGPSGGPTGPTGPPGQCLQCSTGEMGVGVGVKGDTGPQGLQGVKGDTGPQGLQGAAGIGVKGDTGSTGPQGLQGFQGATGPQGVKGDTGPAGSSSSIDLSTYVSKSNNSIINGTLTTTGFIKSGATSVGTKGFLISDGTVDTNVYLTNTNATNTYLQKIGGTLSGMLDMGSNKITSSYTPLNNVDLTNKTYVDGLHNISVFNNNNLTTIDTQTNVWNITTVTNGNTLSYAYNTGTGYLELVGTIVPYVYNLTYNMSTNEIISGLLQCNSTIDNTINYYSDHSINPNQIKGIIMTNFMATNTNRLGYPSDITVQSSYIRRVEVLYYIYLDAYDSKYYYDNITVSKTQRNYNYYIQLPSVSSLITALNTKYPGTLPSYIDFTIKLSSNSPQLILNTTGYNLSPGTNAKLIVQPGNNATFRIIFSSNSATVMQIDSTYHGTNCRFNNAYTIDNSVGFLVDNTINGTTSAYTSGATIYPTITPSTRLKYFTINSASLINGLIYVKDVTGPLIITPPPSGILIYNPNATEDTFLTTDYTQYYIVEKTIVLNVAVLKRLGTSSEINSFWNSGDFNGLPSCSISILNNKFELRLPSVGDLINALNTKYGMLPTYIDFTICVANNMPQIFISPTGYKTSPGTELLPIAQGSSESYRITFGIDGTSGTLSQITNPGATDTFIFGGYITTANPQRLSANGSHNTVMLTPTSTDTTCLLGMYRAKRSGYVTGVRFQLQSATTQTITVTIRNGKYNTASTNTLTCKAFDVVGSNNTYNSPVLPYANTRLYNAAGTSYSISDNTPTYVDFNTIDNNLQVIVDSTGSNYYAVVWVDVIYT